jgi:hypothetical protein
MKIKMQRWIPSLAAAVALAGSASLCQAQPVITLSNDTSESSAFYDGGPAGQATYTWQSTGGPNGGGCIQGVIAGGTTNELDPAFNVSFTAGQYLQVTVQMKVDSSSGTTGTGGSGGYGNKQLAFRDASYSWNGVGYGTIYPPAANGWVTYTFSVPGMANNVAHLQLQLQASAGYSGPVTIYIGDVTIVPVPNPALLNAFTNSGSVNWQNYGMAASWDSSQDAPYYDPVNGAGPTTISPSGSVEFQPTTGSYQGGQLNMGFNPSLFQSVAFDVYYDGPTPSTTNTYGGFQVMIANGASPYNWAWIGQVNFNAGMIGQWTHFNFPCASSGVLNAAGFAFQSIPGNTGSPAGANPFTFHIDNIQAWNPVSHPNIIGLTPGTPGGVQMTLDADGTANNNDQEGITSPSADNDLYNFFWINQTPATYSFTLTNFPAPAAAFASTPTAPASVGAGFDAHVYLCNGDSMTAYANDFGYNQTYSGAPFNMLDYLGMHVQNAIITNLVTYITNIDTTITTNTTYGLASGVVAIIDWKTNAPSANATNRIVFNFPNMTNANGTWTLNFTDNTHGNIVAADGSVNSFTLPDFYNDPNYTGNFSPGTSMVQFGVFKNGNSANNSLSTTFTQVVVTNANSGITSTNYNDSFSGPGLTANYLWQVAEYYLDASDRAIWQPSGTAYWIKWNTTASGWGVQSSSNLLSSWGSGGVTYTYADATGTNTLGAIPTASLPAGDAAFFRLVK